MNYVLNLKSLRAHAEVRTRHDAEWGCASGPSINPLIATSTPYTHTLGASVTRPCYHIARYTSRLNARQMPNVFALVGAKSTQCG
jgi:hypothetical protein